MRGFTAAILFCRNVRRLSQALRRSGPTKARGFAAIRLASLTLLR